MATVDMARRIDEALGRRRPAVTIPRQRAPEPPRWLTRARRRRQP